MGNRQPERQRESERSGGRDIILLGLLLSRRPSLSFLGVLSVLCLSAARDRMRLENSDTLHWPSRRFVFRTERTFSMPASCFAFAFKETAVELKI